MLVRFEALNLGIYSEIPPIFFRRFTHMNERKVQNQAMCPDDNHLTPFSKVRNDCQSDGVAGE
jgi:hypothetical protein